MLNTLNEIARDFAPLVDSVMMLATVAAVAIALYSVRQSLAEKQVRINFDCGVSSIMHPRPSAGANVLYHHHHFSIMASLANVGLVPTSVPYLSFGLRVSRRGPGSLMNPQTDYRDKDPLPLPPGDRISIELRPPEQLIAEIVSLRPKWFPRHRCSRFKITFATNAGQVFHARISKELRDRVKEGLVKLPVFYDPSGGKSSSELQEEATRHLV